MSALINVTSEILRVIELINYFKLMCPERDSNLGPSEQSYLNFGWLISLLSHYGWFINSKMFDTKE